MSLFIKLGLVTMCAVAAVSAAVAEDSPTPEQQVRQAIETRQSLFKLMNWNFAPLAAMLRNRIPFDASVAQKAAMRVEMLAPMIPELFQQDTGRPPDIKTRARESIWSGTSDFAAKAQDLVNAAVALTSAAKTGDRATILKATVGVGKACGSCHDSFRED
jgi:cytochrome c556